MGESCDYRMSGMGCDYGLRCGEPNMEMMDVDSSQMMCVEEFMCDEMFECGAMRLIPTLAAAAFFLS